jgi:membrane-associated phospholipid phosphatase
MGGPVGSSQFALAVSFSRVYFHCHYFGDTVAGMLVGVLVGTGLIRMGLKAMLKTIFEKYGGPNINDDIYS